MISSYKSKRRTVENIVVTEYDYDLVDFLNLLDISDIPKSISLEKTYKGNDIINVRIITKS